MKTTQMKEILLKKLHDENLTYLKKSDISIKKANENKYIITLKDFEPFSWSMSLSIDNDFDNTYEVTISQYYNNKYDELVSYQTSRITYDIEYALIELGYYIGTRF